MPTVQSHPALFLSCPVSTGHLPMPGSFGFDCDKPPTHCVTVQTSSFQNYMGPLRLVLSPADMAAIFINLEVRSLAFS